MRLTQEIDYAFRIVEYLSTFPGEIVPASTISEEMEIPIRFTLKILRKLTQGNITKSKRGVNGGYSLAEENKVYNLYEVIVAVSGPIVINRCLHNDHRCVHNVADKHCMIHAQLANIQRILIKELKNAKFNMSITEFELKKRS